MLDPEWRTRLKAALKDKKRSARAVSMKAGAAEGYVSGILNDGKEPTIGMLMAVCDAVPVSPIYVLLGIDVAPEDLAILRALHENPMARDGILSILRAQAAPRSDE